MLKNTLTICFLLRVIFVSAAPSSLIAEPASGCDTIVTTEGKIYVCNILRHNAREIQFSLCDDPSETVYAIPVQRVASVKKMKPVAAVKAPVIPDIQRITQNTRTAPAKKPPHEKQAPVHDAKEMANMALVSGIFSIFLTATFFLSPAALLLGVVAISKGIKVLHLTKGNPRARKLRRKARWAIILGAIGVVLSFTLMIWLLNALTNLPDLSNFSFGLGGG